MKDKILELRLQGKTYNQIVKILNCSKSTVSYYCGKEQKEKNKQRARKRRENDKGRIFKKIDNFLIKRIGDFKIERTNGKIVGNFSSKDAIKILSENPVCYLTGKQIDLKDRKSFELDHIIPASRGGENTLENMGLTCKEANRAKHDLTKEEFINLCKNVLIYQGYEIKLKSGEIEGNSRQTHHTFSMTGTLGNT